MSMTTDAARTQLEGTIESFVEILRANARNDDQLRQFVERDCVDSVAALDTLTSEIDRLRAVCAEAYQFAGAVGASVRVLDNLWAAAEGKPLPHISFLPVSGSECDPL